MFQGLTLVERPTEHSRSTQVIIAALNEEQGIGPTITELLEYLQTQRVPVVDGNSCDRTVEIAKNCGAGISARVIIEMAQGGD
jgi:glycosyltransferase involved in cell wall biosynthesis